MIFSDLCDDKITHKKKLYHNYIDYKNTMIQE